MTSAWAAKRAMSYLLEQFHQDVQFWINLCEVMDIRPTYLVDIFHRDYSNLE